MNGTSVEITLSMLRFGCQDWDDHRMSPETYFDLDPGEIPEFDSVPIHAHMIEFFPSISRECIKATKITIFDSLRKKRRVITEAFWNSGRNRVIERQDSLGEENDDWEVIVDVEVNGDPSLSESLRLGRNGGLLEALSHYFISQQPDGSEIERSISTR